MFTRTVHPLVGFLVQQHPEIMTTSHFLHGGHQQLVMIDSQIRLFKNRGALELIRGHLVMAGLDRDSQAMALVFQLFHESRNPCRDRAEILILQLLILRGRMPHERATT